MEQIKWVWSLMNRKSHRWHIFALILCVITNMTILVNPTLTARIVDDVIVAQNPDPLPMLLFCIMGFAVVHSCMRYVMAILMEYTSQQMLFTLRQRLFAKLQHQDMHFFDVHRTGDLMTRMSSDMDWVRHFVAGTDYMLTDCIVGFLTTMTYFFFVSWKLALALVCIMPLLLIICVVYSKSIAPLFATMRDRHADMNTQAQENIAANRVVKAFAREEYEKASFDEKSKAFREAQLNINKRWLTFYPAIDILANLASMVTIFLGAVFLIQGEITAGQLSIFINLTWAISNPMRLIGNYLDQVQQFLTRARKVMELDLARPDIVDGDQAVSHGRMKGKIEFRHVSFAYNTQTVLDDVDFTVEPGQTLAIMGPTGSGKTTMIHLLAHFYNPKQGQILVDDCDVRKWKLQELRGGIGTATQDVFLFSDTVEGNIAFGNQELTEDEVKDFAYRAAAGDFIPKLSEGYDTIIGERGVGLSGGQKQRIALARALAVKPSILIMDDTTSAVDMETEQFIQKQLRELPYDCTKIIIAQRISSVKDADLILVLKNGRIAERGKHEDLLRNRGYYYETFCLQNGIDPEKEAV